MVEIIYYFHRYRKGKNAIFAFIEFKLLFNKSSISMKKLVAILAVAGMVFVSCGTKTEDVVADDATVTNEQVQDEQTTSQDETAPATTEENAETATPVAE